MRLLALMLLTGSAFATEADRFKFATDCALDTKTELTWQLHARDYAEAATYFWFNSDETSNGHHQGYKEFPDKAANSPLGLGRCNSEDLINYHNERETCGRANWRLPTKNELLYLVHREKTTPMTFEPLKPFTQTVSYLTSESVRSDNTKVWAVDFKTGLASGNFKRSPAAVRLVSDNY